MENITLISSLTFTVPPAIFTGVIPNPDCLSTAAYKPSLSATSMRLDGSVQIRVPVNHPVASPTGFHSSGLKMNLRKLAKKNGYVQPSRY